MFYSFSFNYILDKDFELGQNYMATRGIILKQTDTHILLEVENIYNLVIIIKTFKIILNIYQSPKAI